MGFGSGSIDGVSVFSNFDGLLLDGSMPDDEPVLDADSLVGIDGSLDGTDGSLDGTDGTLIDELLDVDELLELEG